MASNSSPSTSPRGTDFTPVDSAQREVESISSSTLKVSVNLPEVVQTALVSLWEDHKYTDVTFLINGHRIPAHKAILASQSEYFDRMLFGELKEASMDEIPLQNVSLKTFQTVLHFAYSGTLHMEEVALHVVLEVVTAADHFRFVALKEALVDILSNHISLDTVIPLLVHSDTYHLPELYQQCLSFIESKPNTTKVLQSNVFLHLPEENLIKIISRDALVAPELEIFRAVVRWKEHNNSDAEQTERVLQHIRLSEFSLQELFNEVDPTKLFCEKSIMTALRLQHTLGVTESQGRGMKEANQNLFTKPNTVFDHHYQSPGRAVNTVFRLSLNSKKQDPFGVGRSYPYAIVSLGDMYVVNYLSMKGHPGSSDEMQRKKSFSYTVEVSRDKFKWLKLFDYSSFACRSYQNLPFPKQTVRYIRVSLTGKSDTALLQLLVCCYADNQKPFKFLSKGIIAPQYEQEVAIIPFREPSKNGTQVCTAHFCQPYSVSLLKFHLNCSDPNITEVDITVYAGVNEGLEGKDVLQTMEKASLQSPVVVEMQERVIGFMEVIIRKVYKKVDSSKGEGPGHTDGAVSGAGHKDSSHEEELPSPPEGDVERIFKIANVFCRVVV